MNTGTRNESITAKRVGFLELFFDLVFVFAITQLVTVLHHDHSTSGWGNTAILLWLVWWAWSQYAWTGNAINLDRRSTQIWVLVATGAMLAAAAEIPHAFDNRGVPFGLTYAAVRLIGLGLYWFGLRDDSAHRAALQTYIPVQLAGLALVAGGSFAPGGWRTLCWTIAILVDVVSVFAAGRREFRVDPAHFAERHGLIVIIALGESVVATGATASDIGIDARLGLVLALAFVAVAGLWWCYFDWVHHAAEERLAGEPDHRTRAKLARDLFTLSHFPIVGDTVVFAAAIEEALMHPNESLGSFGAMALGAGVTLYLGGFVLGSLRATGSAPMARVFGLIGVVAASIAARHVYSATVAVGIVAGLVVAIAIAESRREVAE